MNYLSLMTNDEIKYICSVINPKIVSEYFKRHPKEFAKILPGFRPNKINSSNIPDLLFKNRNRDFIASFLEKNISRWISEIQEHLNQCMEEGNSKDTAYIRILSQSFFAENVPLYFKLIEEEHSEEYNSMLFSTVVEWKKMLKKQKKLEGMIASKGNAIEQLQSKLDSTIIALENSKSKETKYTAEIKSLKQKNKNIDEQKNVIQKKEKIIADLEVEIAQLRKSEKNMKLNLDNVLNDHKKLKIQIRGELEKQQIQKFQQQTSTLKPLCPTDMEDFKNYLGYNLEDIGISSASDAFSLLENHLCDILFQGIPIIINRGTGVPIINCVANALIGRKSIATLTYHKDISSQEIEVFLLEDMRVICLDGFLGNYNETELLSLLERHRNKIIFLTLAFDRTLRFVPYEIFRYAHYLNLNRIPALSMSSSLTEDPSEFEEIEIELHKASSDTRYSPLLRKILNDLGFSSSLAVHKCSNISNEQDLCCTLAFDILPYCTDVLQIQPFSVSEQLLKYAGEKGRCSYKNLLKEWFVL